MGLVLELMVTVSARASRTHRRTNLSSYCRLPSCRHHGAVIHPLPPRLPMTPQLLNVLLGPRWCPMISPPRHFMHAGRRNGGIVLGGGMGGSCWAGGWEHRAGFVAPLTRFVLEGEGGQGVARGAPAKHWMVGKAVGVQDWQDGLLGWPEAEAETAVIGGYGKYAVFPDKC